MTASSEETNSDIVQICRPSAWLWTKIAWDALNVVIIDENRNCYTVTNAALALETACIYLTRLFTLPAIMPKVTANEIWQFILASMCKACTATEIILDRKWSPTRRKWSPTVNGPRTEMIPKLNREWSWTANDPRCGPQMIPLENEEWHGVCFHVFYLFYFHHPNDKC